MVNRGKPYSKEALVIPAPTTFSRSLSPDLVFHFQEGIPAFEQAHKYVIVNDDSIRPFIYLKATDYEPLHFVCIDPFVVHPSYSVKLTGQDLAQLGLNSPGEALVLCLVTIGEDPMQTTANLMAPIVLNIVNCLGRQVIQEDSPLRFNLWEASARQECQIRRFAHVDSDTEVG